MKDGASLWPWSDPIKLAGVHPGCICQLPCTAEFRLSHSSAPHRVEGKPWAVRVHPSSCAGPGRLLGQARGYFFQDLEGPSVVESCEQWQDILSRCPVTRASALRRVLQGMKSRQVCQGEGIQAPACSTALLHVHTLICTCLHTHMCTFTHIQLHICALTHMHTLTHSHVHTLICAHVHTHMCTFTCSH